MIVRLTQIDGKLPNLALMKIAAAHKSRGDEVLFSKRIERDPLEPDYGAVYGSAIFAFSAARVAAFKASFPNAIVGGTWNVADSTTVEAALGLADDAPYDYSLYPNFDASIGFTQRGCRFKCGFCVVPKKEGGPRAVSTVAQIWRGSPRPRHLHLLDNDFFGQPRHLWEGRIAEIRDGGFKVCLNQGVNIRTIDADAAAALASIQLRDDGFERRRLYTAWDNLGDEERFFRGVDLLDDAGIPPTCLLVYMLVGYDRRETWERVLYRFDKMVARGIRPYPMVFGERERTLPLGGCEQRIGDRTLGEFQRWAIRRLYTVVPFEDYDVGARRRKPVNTRPAVNTSRKRDRHAPGYMAAYMRRRRAAQRDL
jgi:hypothetical protein